MPKWDGYECNIAVNHKWSVVMRDRSFSIIILYRIPFSSKNDQSNSKRLTNKKKEFPAKYRSGGNSRMLFNQRGWILVKRGLGSCWRKDLAKFQCVCVCSFVGSQHPPIPLSSLGPDHCTLWTAGGSITSSPLWWTASRPNCIPECFDSFIRDYKTE